MNTAETRAATAAGDDGRGRRTFAVAGIVSGAVGIAVSEAVALALRAEPGPVAAVAAAVRDLTPGPLANRLVHLVGSLDKPLLIAGTVLFALSICAVAGILTRRYPLWPDVIFVVLAGIGLLAVALGPDPTVGAGLAVVAGLVTWVAALRALTGPLRGEQPTDDSRRGFLVRSVLLIGAAGTAYAVGRWASGGLRQVEQARRLLRLPVHRGVVPEGAEVPVEQVEPWRTPNRDFYVIDTAIAKPTIDPAQWRLRVHGMVDREVELSFDALAGRRLTEAWLTLCCVSNPVGGDLIGNAWWSGVPIREVLAEVGVDPRADAVLQTSQDDWTCGTPIEALTDDRNALLALAMNGRPLPVEHGFPVRMVVPGLYGYVSATKWLVDLEVTRFDRISAYWTDRGWAERGPIKTQSRIDVPRDGQQVAAGALRVGGCAWAQHVGIERVEVQLDGGAWQPALLGRVPNADTWVQWTATIEVEAGEHTLAVRATDRTGETQTAVRTYVVPSGATGRHRVSFTAG